MRKIDQTTTPRPVEGLSAIQLAEGLIISVKESRKILGKVAKEISDEELAKQILILSDIAPILLKYKHFDK